MAMPESRARCEIIVVGAGPAGLLAALALAREGFDTTVCGKLPTPSAGVRDMRTAALLTPSLTMLDRLGVWPDLARHCAPLHGIRIIDDMGQVVRAPEIIFRGADIGQTYVGWNVPNSALIDALLTALSRLPTCRLRIGVQVTAVRPEDEAIAVHSDDGDTWRGCLVVAADGQNSLARKAAGIGVRRWDYPQAAVVANLEHSRSHHGISTEFHRTVGPCTVVPLPGRRSSLVWMERTERASQLAQLNDDEFRDALSAQLQGLLGEIRWVGPRRAFPLRGVVAETAGDKRVALVGEAAHAFPPIGAQGLNLTFRDVAWLVQTLRTVRAKGEDPGSAEALKTFDTTRRADVYTRAMAVDGLNRALTSAFFPVGLLRGAVLHAASAVAPFKRFLMQSSMTGPGEIPELMLAATKHAKTEAVSLRPPAS